MKLCDCQAEAQIKASFKFFWMTRILKCLAEPVEAFSNQVPFDRWNIPIISGLRVTFKSYLSLAPQLRGRSLLLRKVSLRQAANDKYI